MEKQGRKSQEAIVQQWGRGPVPTPPGICVTLSLSSFSGTRAFSKAEAGNFRETTRFQEAMPCHLTTNHQQKVTHLAALTPNFAYKNFSLKTIRDFGVLNMSRLFSWLGPAIKPSLLQIPVFFGLTIHGAHKLGFGNISTGIIDVNN